MPATSRRGLKRLVFSTLSAFAIFFASAASGRAAVPPCEVVLDNGRPGPAKPANHFEPRGTGSVSAETPYETTFRAGQSVWVTIRNRHPIHVSPFRLSIESLGNRAGVDSRLCLVDAFVRPLTGVTYRAGVFSASSVGYRVKVGAPPNLPVDVLHLDVQIHATKASTATIGWELSLFNVDDRIDAYINSKKIGSCQYLERCTLDLTPSLVKGKKNTLKLTLYNIGGPYAYGYSLARKLRSGGRRVFKNASCGRVQPPQKTCTRWGRHPVGRGQFTKEIITIEIPD